MYEDKEAWITRRRVSGHAKKVKTKITHHKMGTEKELVEGRKPYAIKCKCGADAFALCDFQLGGAKEGKTCDMPLCEGCVSKHFVNNLPKELGGRKVSWAFRRDQNKFENTDYRCFCRIHNGIIEKLKK